MSNLGIFDVFLLAGACNGFILAFAIYRAREREGGAWKYLCALVLVFSAGIAFDTVAHKFFAGNNLHPYFTTILFLLIGPCVYFYVRAVVGDINRKVVLINLVPIFVMLGLLMFMITGVIGERGQNIISGSVHVIIGIQFIMYCVLSYRLLRRHAIRIADTYSSIEKIRLSWLRFLVGCFALAILFAGATDLIDEMLKEENGWHLYWIYVSCVVYAIGYKGLRQPEIWKERMPEKLNAKKKYEKTTIDPAKSVEYKKRLDDAMDRKVFLDPELSMPALAEQLDIPAHHLSQVINESGMNFYEFTNRQRFEFAKKTIEDAEDPVNITRIAFDSGFNSISAFNTAFRRFGGMTPSEWKSIARDKNKKAAG
jgi:AraC-like DNA-binding protein